MVPSSSTLVFRHAVHVVRAVRVILLALVPVCAAAASPPAPAPFRPDFVPDQVLVRFQEGASPSQRLSAVAGAGAEVIKEDALLDYLTLRIPENASVDHVISFLSSRPGVLRAEPNYYYRALVSPDVPQDPDLADLPASPNQWGIFKTGIPSLWRHGGGGDPGVKIAIIDTGIDNFASPHVDLAANVSGLGHDLIDDDAVPTDAGAFAGHGTHVAGIAAAVSNASGIAGVAYGSTLMIVRVLDCSAGPGCPGSSSDIADGVRWAADNGARVINLSLGGPASMAVESAVIYAIGKKCIVVAASGNESAPVVSYPAGYDPVVAVGATDSGDGVAAFSNWGARLDVVAPGVAIRSTYPGGYTSLNGTSMASPFVAGIAALTAAKNPSMTPLEFQAWIRTRTTDLVGTHDGYGRVDFNVLEDWSDASGYPPASHENFLWEWLGADASPETGMFDGLDTDGRPNYGGGHDRDGYDDGVFPGSFSDLPYQPAHLGGPAGVLHVKESVGRWDGPRYGAGAATSLHLDSWFDWDSDLTFEPPSEHEVIDHAENPGTWGANAKTVAKTIVPPDEHLLGNPLVVRTRLAYGASVGAPGAMPAGTGEVEDDEMVNFVEDFDTALHVINPGVYMTMGGGWLVTSDPTPPALHHGTWHFASTHHPGGIGIPCNGVVEALSVMSTPAMDWKEYTEAHLIFWFCHQYNPCSPVPDKCRLRLDIGGAKVDLMAIPVGSGTISLDLSSYIGPLPVKIEFVEDTDLPGIIAIDDVVVWAFDDEKPKPVSNLAVSRVAGTRQLDLTWSAPAENDIIGSPPAEPLSNTYDVRYAAAAITSEADWRKATPFVPKDGTLAVPVMPGGGQSASLDVPSAAQAYYVALKTGDEVNNVSALSNSPGNPGSGTPGVFVLSLNDTTVAPGDTALLLFDVENTGNIPDAYAISTLGTESWPILSQASLSLDPGVDSVVVVLVAVPSGATAGADTVSLMATSVSDGTVSDLDQGVVTVTPATSVETVSATVLPEVASLRLTGANPFVRSTSFELALPAASRGHAAIYDVSGRRVRTIVDGDIAAGVQPFSWDGRDDRGRSVEPGVYFLDVHLATLTKRERLVMVE